MQVASSALAIGMTKLLGESMRYIEENRLTLYF